MSKTYSSQPKDTSEIKKLIEEYKRAAASLSPTRGTDMLSLAHAIHDKVAALTKQAEDD